MSAILQNYNYYVPITPSDTVDFPEGVCDGLFCSSAGLITVVREDNVPVQFTDLAGTILPLRARRINSTGTHVNALVVALYQR